MPITPTKTGRKTVSLAGWLFGEPSYLMDALIWFVITNIMIGMLLLVALVLSRK